MPLQWQRTNLYLTTDVASNQHKPDSLQEHFQLANITAMASEMEWIGWAVAVIHPVIVVVDEDWNDLEFQRSGNNKPIMVPVPCSVNILGNATAPSLSKQSAGLVDVWMGKPAIPQCLSLSLHIELCYPVNRGNRARIEVFEVIHITQKE